MIGQLFTTIHTMIPASDWVAIYAADEAPFYYTYHLPCIVAGRTKSFSRKTRKWTEDEGDTIAFMDVDCDGLFDDPCDSMNFLAVCHERDITDALKAHWSQLGQAYLEKSQKKSAAKDTQ